MQHIFTPTYKHQRSIFWVDILALLFIVFMSHYLFDENSKRLFSPVWIATTVLFLYLFGRYSRVSAAVTLAKITTVFGAVILAILTSYPFMSGSDRGRAQFTVFLFVITMGCLLLLSWIRKAFTGRSGVHMVIFTREPEKYTPRIEEIKQQLSPQHHKITVKTDFEDIKHNGNSLFLIATDDVLADNKFSLTLLERGIQGRAIVNFLDSYAEITGRIPLELISNQWLIEHTSAYSQKVISLRVGRIIDLAVGCILPLILFIPILFIALVVKLESAGPVFFKQERLGKNKHPFILYKFRSMRVDAESAVPQWATKNDSRVTRIGAFLRKSHLDELPQLLNLLRGDITLVGPRPIREFFANKLAKEIPYYDLRFLVKPGITGWAQVKGPYGCNMEEQREKFEMDLFYILKSNFLLNLFIIIDTIKTLFNGQGR